jgi:hypothetical protein
MRSLLLVPVLGLVAGCDYSAEFLFAGAVEGVPGVQVILTEDGDRLHEPAIITNYEAIEANAIYFEVAPTGTAELGGATLEFVGTGGPVCVWVDPESASWNQAFEENSTPFSRQFALPDNHFDDGDVDLTGGRSVFYTGTPGEKMGDFVINYEDELGNEVAVNFVECAASIGRQDVDPNMTSGKGLPEYCYMPTTAMGVSYTIALTTFSTPFDDDRLSVGLLLANGDCASLQAYNAAEHQFNSLGAQPQQDECLLRGESLRPVDPGPYYGKESIADLTYEDFELFELSYCRVQGELRLDDFCALEDAGLRGYTEEEIDELSNEELLEISAEWQCQRDEVIDDDRRCYCGDPRNTPQGGAG